MNAQTPIDAANREAARRVRNQTEALEVVRTATALSEALDRSGGIYSTTASHRLLDLCNAIIELTDGNAEAMRESLMAELSCDEHGNPVRDVVEAPWSDADKQRVFGGYR